jgi:PPM family protein phosphatase
MSSLTYAGRSDTGRRRSSNQDRWSANAELGLYVVADGIATSNDGALAAQLVTDRLATYVARHLDPRATGDADAAARLRDAVAEASDDLYAQGRADLRVAGSATTVVAAVMTPTRAVIAHLGDSRAYLCRDNALERLTCDHNLFEALIHTRGLSTGDAAGHRARHVLTRHVAMNPPALPDVCTIELCPGDRILLCSDGLHGVVTEEMIAEILGRHTDPGDACDALIDAANHAGGPDNVTALVVAIPPAAAVADGSASTAEPQEGS